MSKDKFKMSRTDLAKAWKESYQKKDEFVGGMEYEDGRYGVALTGAERGESKGSGRDQVMFEFTFLDGDYKGKSKRDYNGLDRPEAIPFLMRKIIAMGFEAPEEINDLEALLKKMVKAHPKLRIQLKTKGDFQNVYVDGPLLEEGEEADGSAEQEEDAPAPALDKHPVSKEKPEEEEAPASEEEEEIEVGMSVRCLDDDDVEIGSGKIKTIDPDAMEVIVTMDGTNKNRVFAVEKIRLLPKETAKPKEEPKKGLKARR